MAYRMTAIGDRVKVGITQMGHADIEVYGRPCPELDSEVTQVMVPREAVRDLAAWLLANTA